MKASEYQRMKATLSTPYGISGVSVVRNEPVADLIYAIYEQAVTDYVAALAASDATETAIIERFLLSEAYGYMHGKYLLEQAQKEYKLADILINTFIASGMRQRIISPCEVSIPILKNIISVRHRKRLVCSLVDKNHPDKYILKYRKGVYPTNGKKEKMVQL